MSITYAQLANIISEMTDEEKNQDVTVHVAGVDEFYSVNTLMITKEAKEDRLDDGHFFLSI